jgi:threonylcarbamoyladenosine tRNA methylthiotransferase MtaB
MCLNLKNEMKISFLTYGCKVNQYETELIRQMMLGGGLTEAADPGGADIYLVNTCTVTAKIDSEISRKIKQLKSKPGARVILTGCLAQRGGADVEKLGADWIIANGSKLDPGSYPAGIFPVKISVRETVLAGFSGRNKAFVKVEDGCDRFCAYCTVPLVRGSDIRSRDASEIISEIEKLTAAGFSELIMTGVNLGRFGAENGDKTALYGLLKKITLLKGGFRVRLSSMSPADLDDDVIQLAADNPGRICPHFHLSMQSGDDAVLKRMNRRYDTKLYRDKAEFIASRIKLPGITTDVIAGFPGESGVEFENTLAFINDIPLTRLHVFPYSDRPGTKATQMSGKVDDTVKKERVKRLLNAAEKKENDFAVKNTGLVRTALIEDPNKKNELFGYTENYIRVLIDDTQAARAKVNGLARVRITEVTASCVKAELAGE